MQFALLHQDVLSCMTQETQKSQHEAVLFPSCEGGDPLVSHRLCWRHRYENPEKNQSVLLTSLSYRVSFFKWLHSRSVLRNRGWSVLERPSPPWYTNFTDKDYSFLSVGEQRGLRTLTACPTVLTHDLYCLFVFYSKLKVLDSYSDLRLLIMCLQLKCRPF